MLSRYPRFAVAFPTEILPREARVASFLGDSRSARLLAEERDVVRNAATKRRGEFAAGRHAAREAMKELGQAETPVLSSRDRSPIWPHGFVGSITHSDQCCAAAVAPRHALSAIGIDVEEAGRVPPELADRILTPNETGRLNARSPTERAHLLTCIFSAKESFYKAYYPLTRTFLEFSDVEVEVSSNGSTFTAELVNTERPRLLGRSRADGRFARSHWNVFTALWLRTAV